MNARRCAALTAAAAAAVSVLALPSTGAAAEGGAAPNGGSSGPARAAPNPETELRAALDALVAAGATGAIARVDDGRRVRTAVSGVARLDPRRLIGANDSVRVASITKSFVATVVLQLVGEHRLRLTDTVERWLPGLLPGGSQITIRQLLNHTSGVFNYTDDQAFLATALADPSRAWSARELIAVATAQPPVFPPGKGWSYSNTNYLLVGLIAEAATGRDLPRLITDRITRPLHLTATYLATSARVTPWHAHGYLPPSQTGAGYLDTTSWSPTLAGAAGAVVSNAPDLARFYGALLSGRLLPPAQLHDMLTTVDAIPDHGYGLGIYFSNTSCGTVWGHEGGFPGYTSVAVNDRAGTRSGVLFVPTDLDETTRPLFDRAVDTIVCQMFGAHPPAQNAAPRATATGMPALVRIAAPVGRSAR